MLFSIVSSLLLFSYAVTSQTICRETEECADQVLSGTGDIECSGYFACSESELSFTNFDCWGSYGCYESDIIGSQADCWGELACADSNITTTSVTRCYGDNACLDATINAKDLLCYGHEGCEGADFSQSEDWDCTSYFSCYDATYPTITQTNSNCWGYFACADAVIDGMNNEIDCSAQYACYQASFTFVSGSQDVVCDASNSCRSATLTGSGTGSDWEIQCTDYYSCQYSTLSTSGDIFCYGPYSCFCASMNGNTAGAEILLDGFNGGALGSVDFDDDLGQVYVYARGYFGARKTWIYSGTNNTVDIEFLGYLSGARAVIFCQEDSTCNINCASYGCLYTRVRCDPDATCSVTCDDDLPSRFCATIRTVNLPSASQMTAKKLENHKISLEWAKTDDIENDDELQSINKESEHHKLMLESKYKNYVKDSQARYDSYLEKKSVRAAALNKKLSKASEEMSNHKDSLGENDGYDSNHKISKDASITADWWWWRRTTTVSCLEANECRNDTLDGTYLYCEGFRSCYESDLDFSIISCDGNEACFNAEIDGSKIIYCDGYLGCSESNITGTDVYCNGYDACFEANIDVADDLFCLGYRGCRRATLDVTDVAYCGSREACLQSTLTAGDNVICYDRGCRDSTVTTSSNIYCPDVQSCDLNDMLAVDVFCLAENSCGTANINTTDDLYCSGFGACDRAEAYIADNLYCDGYQGCDRSDMYMLSGSIVDLDGLEAGSDMTLNFNNDLDTYSYIFAYGYISLFRAVINSGEGNQLYVDLRGLFAGDQLTVNCEDGSQCEINCVGFGCGPDMTINCIDEAECSRNCDDAVNSTYCPTLVNTTSAAIAESKNLHKHTKKSKPEISAEAKHLHESIATSVPDHEAYVEAKADKQKDMNEFYTFEKEINKKYQTQMSEHRQEKDKMLQHRYNQKQKKNKNKKIKQRHRQAIKSNANLYNSNAQKDIKNNYTWIIISATVIFLIAVWVGVYSCVIKKRIETPRHFTTQYQSI